MTIWLLALILTAIACATFFVCTAVPNSRSTSHPQQRYNGEHFRAQLRAIESDVAIGRLGQT